MSSCAQIVFSPGMPLWCLLLLVAAACWLAWRGYAQLFLAPWQRRILVGMRWLSILILALLVCQPARRVSRVVEEKPVLAVLIDQSASMVDNPTGDPQTRGERVRQFLSSRAFQKLEDRFSVRCFGFGSELTEQVRLDKIAFREPGSAIARNLAACQERLQGEEVAGILLFSDGLDQFPPGGHWKNLPPVYIPELEEGTHRQKSQADFSIRAVSCPRRVLVNWKTAMSVTIRRNSGGGLAQFPVILRGKGGELERKQVVLKDGEQLAQVSFEIEPLEVGQAVYEVKIDPEGDSESANNLHRLLVEVTDARRRVLYLEGTGRWEFKFLKRALLSEKNLELHAYLRGGNGEFINFEESGTGLLPKLDEKSLRPYRTVILGNLLQSELTEPEIMALRRFVENGGGLLLLGGARSLGPGGIAAHPKLKNLLPSRSVDGAKMNQGNFSLEFTPEGRMLSAFSALGQEISFPKVLTLWAPVQPTASAQVILATGDGYPVLLTSRMGEGRVAQLLTDTMWRWQLGGNAGEKGVYNLFFTQMMHWICPDRLNDDDGERLQIMVRSHEAELHERVVIGAAGGNASGVHCQIAFPGGRRVQLPMVESRLGREVGLNKERNGWRCELVPEEEGSYTLVVESADGRRRDQTLLLVRYPEHERTGFLLNREYLKRLALETKGQFFSWNERDEVMKKWTAKTLTRQYFSEQLLWNRWMWITLLLLCFSLEWFLRRCWDLV